jgi:hypothetical protein
LEQIAGARAGVGHVAPLTALSGGREAGDRDDGQGGCECGYPAFPHVLPPAGVAPACIQNMPPDGESFRYSTIT